MVTDEFLSTLINICAIPAYIMPEILSVIQ